jgi:hypothetical protein
MHRMEKDELNELDIKKAEDYGKIHKKNKKNPKAKIDILDFYHGTNLTPPYSSANSANSYSIKPYQLLPFFKTIIVDILPLPNEELFNEYYGMSVEDLIELERKGKVVIRLPDTYEGYKNIDYLDPIFLQNPQTSFLINTVYGYIINNKLEEEMEDTGNLFKNEFDFGSNLTMEMGMIDPMAIASWDILSGSDPYLVDVDNKTYKTITHNNFNKLSYSGYSNVNTFLKKLLSVGNGRLDWAFTYSNTYTSFLADPTLSSLNGTHMVNYNMKEILNDLIIRTRNEDLRKKLFSESENILSYDIGKTLSEEISAPLLFNFEESLDYDYNGAINALKSLEVVIDEKNKDEIIDLTNELKSEIYKAGQIAENMRGSVEKNPKRIANISTIISLLGEFGGQLTNDPHVKPLLDAISYVGKNGEIMAEAGIIPKIVEEAVKFNKNDHVLYLFNNYENFRVTPRTDKIRIMKSKRVFKDDLSKKYEYYEYIYKKIPIVRVLIEINSRITAAEGPSIVYKGEDKEEGLKIEEFLKEWQKEYFPIEALRLQLKHLFLYGRSYHLKQIVNNNGKKHINPILVRPNFIRPIYKKDQFVAYKIINEKGREKLINKEDIGAFIPSKNRSLVEKYIYMLDLIYPEITNKDKRPKLQYDVLFANLEKGSELSEDYDKSMEILLNTLEIAQYLENLVYIVTILLALGDLNRKFNLNKKALEYYEQAQENLEGKVFSNVMEELEKKILNKIIDTQKFL